MLKTSRIAIVAITKKGKATALKLKKALRGSDLYLPTKLDKCGGLINLTRKLFADFEGIIFCMALGIVARVIAPYIKNKHTDPAVVVVDDAAHFAISLLCGHEGGANKLTIRVANILGAQAIITTASEVNKDIIVGIGCRRGVKKKEVSEAIWSALAKAKCSLNKVKCAATIDLKQNESGLRKACLELEIPLRIISTDLIKNFQGRYQRSSFVKKKIGVEGVSEPCALLATMRARLILPKQKLGKVTVAVAKES